MTRLRKIILSNNENENLTKEHIDDMLSIGVISNVEFLKTHKISNGYYECEEIIKIIKDIIDTCKLIDKKSEELDIKTTISNDCNNIIQICSNTINELNELERNNAFNNDSDTTILQMVDKVEGLISNIKNQLN